MGKASSAKKVARAARAGGRGSGVSQRNLFFPGAIGVIILLGMLLIAFARSDYQNQGVNVSPTWGDHWHAAFGVFICGQGGTEDDLGFLNVNDNFDTTQGIHSHGDSILHIHPSSRAASGENARLRVYVDESPLIDLSDDEVKVGDQSWKEGEDTCNGQEAEVVVAQWLDAFEGGRPAVFTDGFNDLRFREDGEAYVIAFVPRGEYDDIAIPPGTVEQLDRLRGGGMNPEDLFNDPSFELDPSELEDFDIDDLEGLVPGEEGEDSDTTEGSGSSEDEG